jgi:hypothetical protein
MRFAFAPLVVAVVAAPLLTIPAAAQSGEVCFYEHANFQGAALCMGEAQRVPGLPPAANDKISSARIPPGARATVCENVNFGGRCVTLDRSVGNFNEIGMNDMVSSLAIEFGQAGPPPGRPGPGGRDFGMGGPPPPRGPQMAPGPRGPLPADAGGGWEDMRARMEELREECEDGDRRACVRLGIIIGENRERRAQMRRESPNLFWWER